MTPYRRIKDMHSQAAKLQRSLKEAEAVFRRYESNDLAWVANCMLDAMSDIASLRAELRLAALHEKRHRGVTPKKTG